MESAFVAREAAGDFRGDVEGAIPGVADDHGVSPLLEMPVNHIKNAAFVADHDEGVVAVAELEPTNGPGTNTVRHLIC